MLPKTNRLRNRHDFSAVYRLGIRRTSRHLTLRALRHPLNDFSDSTTANSGTTTQPKSPSPTRIGISISQKVSKQAVTRNRIKRQIRAALRQLLPRLSAGWDFVIVVRPSARECKYGQFLQELEQLLAEAEVINGH